MTLEFQARLRLGPFAYEACLAARDEILVLFGHSGAGKSVALQMIAGLLRPDEGRIEVDGAVAFDSSARTNLPAQNRQVGYVEQDLALVHHLNVRQNIEFGSREALPITRGRSDGDTQPDGSREAPAPCLSGGQQQRVALARALARTAASSCWMSRSAPSTSRFDRRCAASWSASGVSWA
jgi:molybdate transport system ATP-binding protein